MALGDKQIIQGGNSPETMVVEYSISIILGRHQNSEYYTLTSIILEKYFGSAFGELGTVLIVITIRTKFSDII